MTQQPENADGASAGDQSPGDQDSNPPPTVPPAASWHFPAEPVPPLTPPPPEGQPQGAQPFDATQPYSPSPGYGAAPGQPGQGQPSPHYGSSGSASGPPVYGAPQYGGSPQTPPTYGAPQYGAPQYGAPQYGQPQYGQPQTGQAQTGQPQTGQPQYGQPQTGQPPYGQPQYGAPQTGQPQYGAPQGGGQQPYGGGQYGTPPPYGSPQYGAPPYGGPQHGAPPYGAPQYGAPQYGAPSPYGPGYPAYGAGQQFGKEPGLAEWWRRLLARLIDGLIIGVVVTPIALAIMSGPLNRFRETVQAFPDLNAPGAQSAVSRAEGRLLVAYFGVLAIISALTFLYDWLQHAKWGQTVGKRALSTKVVSADDRSPITSAAAAKRAAMYALIPVVPLIGGLWALINELWLLWDRRRQCLHDKVAHTIVVKTNDPSATGWPPQQQQRPW